jgi:protein-tyrosine phosphatase
MAEFVFRQRFEESGVNILVSSAGLAALVGHGADEQVIEVMTENGLDISAHLARQLSDELVKKNELILVMELWQQKEIESIYHYARGRVHLLGKWSDMEVEDPYKKPKEAFIEAFVKIDQLCQQWCEKLC